MIIIIIEGRREGGGKWKRRRKKEDIQVYNVYIEREQRGKVDQSKHRRREYI